MPGRIQHAGHAACGIGLGEFQRVERIGLDPGEQHIDGLQAL